MSDYLRTLALISWGWVLVSLLVEAASYVLSVRAHGLLSTLLEQGGVVVTFACLASVARPGPRWRFFTAWAVAISVVLFTAAGRLAARRTGTAQPDYQVSVPVAGMTGPASDLDHYLGAVRADFGRAQSRAEAERRSLDAGR